MSEQEKILKRIGELRTQEQNAIHDLGVIRGRLAEKERDLRGLMQVPPPAPDSEAQAAAESEIAAETERFAAEAETDLPSAETKQATA